MTIIIKNNTCITSSLVTEENHFKFYSRAFGITNIIHGKSLVYGYMSLFSKDYKGKNWHCYTLSNNGYYMAPAIDGSMYLEVADNRFSGSMSADAAGIVVSLFVFGHLAAEADNGNDCSARKDLVNRYYFLKDYAINHIEVEKILDAIN